MRQIALAIALLFAVPAFAQKAEKVKGYVTKQGKYVAPHYRTKADRTKANNWSTKGNRNPYTGKKGSKR